MSFLCNAVWGLLHNQPQKDVVCKKYEYYVEICDYRQSSPLSREDTFHYSTDRNQWNTRHIATTLQRINRVGYPIVINKHLRLLLYASEASK